MEENNLTNRNLMGSSGSKMPVIDYGDVRFSNQELHSSTNIGKIPSCGSMDRIFDELLRDTNVCAETIGALSNEDSHNHNHDDSTESNEHYNVGERRWERGGNREAVRKYRQKKKAHTASLAGELVKLRALNHQLMQRLQSQVTLETEVARLKCLLVDIRGRIEGEIGSFPYQKPVNSLVDPTCLHDGMPGEGVALNVQNLNCMTSLGSTPSLS